MTTIVEAHNSKLVWLDLETTGLIPSKGVILEIGVVITDLELNEIDRRAWIFPHDRSAVLGLMNDYVLNMHMGNGLLKEVWRTPNTNESQSEFSARLAYDRVKTIKSIKQWIYLSSGKTTFPKDCFLAGSSIHFDRAWLTVHAPEILETVSYRMGDVSSFKVFFPGLLTQPTPGTVTTAHRALTDLNCSIDQLSQMRAKLGMA